MHMNTDQNAERAPSADRSRNAPGGWQKNSGRAPLEGIRVLEFGGYLSGPYAGMLLRGLGAEVIKIEPPGGEPFRRGRGNQDYFFKQYNLGKKSVTIDITTDEGREKAFDLIATADVLIENLRAGKLEALGLGPDACREVNPSLIYASVTGFGTSGEYRDRPAYDSIGQSIAGMYSILSDPDQPQTSGTCLADLSCGISMSLGILASLVGRGGADGPGVRMETSMIESLSLLTIDAVTLLDERGISPSRESRNPQAINFCFATRDGGNITIHLSSSPKFWANFTRVIGRPDLQADDRFVDYPSREDNYEELRTLVRPIFLQRTLDEWLALLVEADVPCAPLLRMEEVVEHPQFTELGIFTRGQEGNLIVESPWKFDGTRFGKPQDSPQAGEHNDELACSDRAELVRVGRAEARA